MSKPIDFNALVDELWAVFECIPKEDRDENAWREIADGLEREDRKQLYIALSAIMGIIAKVKAALGDGETDLFGAAPDKVQLMNLLCSLNPANLSTDVIDRLNGEVVAERRLGRTWTALPKSLFTVLYERVVDLEEEEEADAEQQGLK